MTSTKTSLLGLTRAELESFAVALGEPSYRGRQLYLWIYGRRARSFEEMTDLPEPLRRRLDAAASLDRLSLVRDTTAPDGARKLLLEMSDGLRIESVYLPDSPGNTVCISSQVGCALGCAFCATGKMGFYRNLTAGEIVDQVIEVERLTGARLTNVVLMGMGEPLHNYDNVVKALHLLSDPKGIAISRSRITVSTVGITPMIERWCSDDPPAKLAISLHATTDERRASIMPVARAYPLDDLMKSLRRLAHVTRYHVTFEYIMIAGLNDRREDATNLKTLLRNIPVKVNLIRLHPTGSDLQPSSDNAIARFLDWLRQEGIRCTLRESRGVENSAACGMLFAQEPIRPSSTQRRTLDTDD
ncbi:23S rRNA (adenine(2503)-C(2))-methyltransferase RlmN [bacterium]|nr:23S rRNA (adenine(2503)-C(2))-methyltransferase RlmN [bacterium]MBU1985436.1 23S rRNA (adenine(2503)-C(2))-methyltransferase RlmN [bacterium]